MDMKGVPKTWGPCSHCKGPDQQIWQDRGDKRWYCRRCWKSWDNEKKGSTSAKVPTSSSQGPDVRTDEGFFSFTSSQAHTVGQDLSFTTSKPHAHGPRATNPKPLPPDDISGVVVDFDPRRKSGVVICAGEVGDVSSCREIDFMTECLVGFNDASFLVRGALVSCHLHPTEKTAKVLQLRPRGVVTGFDINRHFGFLRVMSETAMAICKNCGGLPTEQDCAPKSTCAYYKDGHRVLCRMCWEGMYNELPPEDLLIYDPATAVNCRQCDQQHIDLLQVRTHRLSHTHSLSSSVLLGRKEHSTTSTPEEDASRLGDGYDELDMAARADDQGEGGQLGEEEVRPDHVNAEDGVKATTQPASVVEKLSGILRPDAPYFIHPSVNRDDEQEIAAFYQELRDQWLKNKKKAQTFATHAAVYASCRTMWLDRAKAEEWFDFLVSRHEGLTRQYSTRELKNMQNTLGYVLQWHDSHRTPPKTCGGGGGAVPERANLSMPFSISLFDILMPLADGKMKTWIDKLDGRDEKEAIKKDKESAKAAKAAAKAAKKEENEERKRLLAAAATTDSFIHSNEDASSLGDSIPLLEEESHAEDTEEEEEEEDAEEEDADDDQTIFVAPSADATSAALADATHAEHVQKKKDKAGVTLEKTTAKGSLGIATSILGLLRDPRSTAGLHDRLRENLSKFNDHVASLAEIVTWLEPPPPEDDPCHNDAEDCLEEVVASPPPQSVCTADYQAKKVTRPWLKVLKNLRSGGIELDCAVVDYFVPQSGGEGKLEVLLVIEAKCNPADLLRARAQRGNLITFLDRSPLNASFCCSSNDSDQPAPQLAVSVASFQAWRTNPIGGWIFSARFSPGIYLPSSAAEVALRLMAEHAGASGWNGGEEKKNNKKKSSKKHKKKQQQDEGGDAEGEEEEAEVSSSLPEFDLPTVRNIHNRVMRMVKQKRQDDPRKLIEDIRVVGGHLCIAPGSRVKKEPKEKESKESKKQRRMEKREAKKARKAAKKAREAALSDDTSTPASGDVVAQASLSTDNELPAVPMHEPAGDAVSPSE